MEPMTTFLIILGSIFLVFILLLWYVAAQKEDESAYLESFINTCPATKKTYHLASVELDYLRGKIKETQVKRFEKMIEKKFKYVEK